MHVDGAHVESIEIPPPGDWRQVDTIINAFEVNQVQPEPGQTTQGSIIDLPDLPQGLVWSPAPVSANPAPGQPKPDEPWFDVQSWTARIDSQPTAPISCATKSMTYLESQLTLSLIHI